MVATTFEEHHGEGQSEEEECEGADSTGRPKGLPKALAGWPTTRRSGMILPRVEEDDGRAEQAEAF